MIDRIDRQGNEMKNYDDLLVALDDFRDRKCFLFDMDGLIFDTEQLFMEQLAVAMADRGYHLTREVYIHTLGMGGELLKKYMLEIYGEKYPFAECSQEAQRRVTQIAEDVGLRVKSQIRDALARLACWDKICAVASSTSSEYVRKYLRVAGLEGYFGEIIGGEMVAKTKPEPEIFLLACDRCGVAPEETVVIEDSENGIRAAHAAGTGTICVPDLVQPSPEVCTWIDALVKR